MNAPRDSLVIQASAEGVTFWIHVTARSRRPGVGGCHAEALRVRVAAPAVAGKATAACGLALAEVLAVPRLSIDIDPGSTGRRKLVQISGDPESLETRLRELSTPSP